MISDITGKSGSAVLEAILNGERNSRNFLSFIDKRVKADPETIVKSLEGNWQPEHLFTLGQSYKMYLTYKNHIAVCDQEIEKQLQRYEASRNEGTIEINKKSGKYIKKGKDKNHPRFDVRGYLEKIHGVDVLSIYGLSDIGGLE